jgi:alkanesulfonate monooxygenase SsuD/methylene tetrahydromethanopterin reductase-like flavin-dependent oxidoreductase (luciferase family)
MTTPEGRTKAKLRQLLAGYTGIYTYWPVPMGYGRTTLDVLGCYRGRFFSVETKADGKKPTLRQTTELNGIEKAMGRTFVIAGTTSPVLDELREWLDAITTEVPYAPHLSPDKVNRRTI